MTAGGINRGQSLPTFMEIRFLSFKMRAINLSYFSLKKKSVLKLWGKGGKEPEKTFSLNSVCAWGGGTVCREVLRKTHNQSFIAAV